MISIYKPVKYIYLFLVILCILEANKNLESDANVAFTVSSVRFLLRKEESHDVGKHKSLIKIVFVKESNKDHRSSIV